MQIAIDVMGGDHAPKAILDGAIDALPLISADDKLLLIGDEAVIHAGLSDAGIQDDRVVVVGSTNDIAMDELPVEAVRGKPDSSIVKMAKLAARKAKNPVDILISAGNTGACVTADQMFLRRLPGVHRPGIAVVMPTFGGPVVICDVGANPDPKPHHLWQYGLMAEVYAKDILGIDSPRVAQMNIGGEEAKGTGIVKQTRDLLKATPNLNYVGYVEGRAVFEHAADVVVTDGFVGNVIIKLAEGMAAGLFRMIIHEMTDSFSEELASQFHPIMKQIYAKHDHHEHGGAPLLGVNGTVIISHGAAEARTITNAIMRSKSMVSSHLNDQIVQRIQEVKEAGIA